MDGVVALDVLVLDLNFYKGLFLLFVHSKVSMMLILKRCAFSTKMRESGLSET